MNKKFIAALFTFTAIWLTACSGNTEKNVNTINSIVPNTADSPTPPISKTIEETRQNSAKSNTPEKSPDGKSAETPPKTKNERIVFPAGATEVIKAGRLDGFDDSHTFLIDLRGDQTFKVENIGDNYVTLSVSDPQGKTIGDMDASCHGNFAEPQTVAGDYKIVVTECKKADPWKGEFKIKISAINN